MISALALSVATLSPTAEAGIYIGNPNLTFEIDRAEHDLASAVAWLDKVRIYDCQGGPTDYPVDAEVDGVATFTVQVAGGDLCDAVLYWGSEVTVTQADDDWTLEYGLSVTVLDLDADPLPPAALVPFDVVAGTFSGTAPDLHVTAD